MSNIEDDLKVLKNIEKLRSIEFKHCVTDREIIAIKNILSEREQDKNQLKECWNNNLELSKRIKELENRLRDINTYILINGIDEPLKTATQIKVENQQQYIIQEKINLLKKKLENSIPKQKVKNEIDEINKKYEDSKDENGESPYYYPEYTIRVLEKLLQESEDK